MLLCHSALSVPAVVLQHIKGSVGEEGGAGHRLVAGLFLRVTQLLHHTLAVPQQLVQAERPAHTTNKYNAV